MNSILNKIKDLFKNFVYKIRYKEPLIMSDEDTLDYIGKKRCSIVRYGDGEINVMLGKDISWFQSDNNKLKDRLIEIAKSNNCNVLICIPAPIGKVKNQKLTEGAKVFWNRHKLRFGGYYNFFFSSQCVLGDSLLTRFYLGVSNKERTGEYVTKLKSLWDKKDLMIVEGYHTKLGVNNDLFDNASGIRRILCPNKNAFDKYEEIINSIIKNHRSEELVLCALGPTATVLAYDLAVNYGIRALDIGHVDIEYMWYLKGIHKRGEIEGKNGGEIETSNLIDDNIPNAIDIIK